MQTLTTDTGNSTSLKICVKNCYAIVYLKYYLEIYGFITPVVCVMITFFSHSKMPMKLSVLT